MQTLETLYRKTLYGKIEVYNISTFEDDGLEPPGYTIKTGSLLAFYQGKLKARKSYVKEGTNIGRSNELSAYEVACNQVEKKYQDKRNREGWKSFNDIYPNFPNKEDLSYEELEQLLQAGIDSEPIRDEFDNTKPMLAKSMYEVKTGVITNKPKLPAYSQPKFNGVRSKCHLELKTIGEGLFASTGKLPVFRSREGREYNVPTNLIKQIAKLFNNIPLENDSLFGCNISIPTDKIEFDGEIYHHGWSLQRIISAVKAENEDTPNLEYWIYDLAIADIEQTDRLKLLNYILAIAAERANITPIEEEFGVRYGNIIKVKSKLVKSEEQADTLFKYYIDNKFEGQIYRDPQGFYGFGKRVSALIKQKKWFDKEYKIVDIADSGKDNYEGASIGKYVCDNGYGKTFEVTPSLSKEERYNLLKNKHKYINKLLTVRFFEYTDDNLPRHAQGLVIRDYE